MKFRTAHKMATYLMAICAFAALALSGTLSPLAVGLAALAIAASWPADPPRFPAARLIPLVNAIAALALFVELVRALGTGDLLMSGARFLLVLLALKLFSRRTNKDYQHIYIISFLMLVAATVLNPGITFGVSFFGYAIAATWALILFHLRREMEDNFLIRHDVEHGAERVEVARILNSRRIVSAPFLAGTAVVSLSIFAIASVLFLSIPRIGFGFFYDQDRSTLHMAGFSDDVTLGGHGVIRDDPTVVMRVVLDDRARLEALPPLHWRGVAYDHYEDGRWSRSQNAPRGGGRITRRGDRAEVRLEFGGRPRDGALGYEVYLEPLGNDVLFGASLPIRFEIPNARRGLRRGRNDELRFPHGAGLAYTVHSIVERPSPAALRDAAPHLPDGYDVYLQLPDALSARVRELAAEITRDAETHYDKVVAIERWLGELDYTREMVSPGAHEPLEHFLFERQRGHCEYFASALAVLARAAGVPTRNVNGFYGGEWNDFADFLAVRAGDAHSWVEVYFHGVGWVTFDPTPAAGTPGLLRGEGGLFGSLRRFGDSLRFQWFQWVIEYDLHRQLRLFRGVADALRSGADTAIASPMERLRDALAARRKPVVIAAVATVAGFALVALVLVGRRIAPGRSARAGRRRRRAKGVAASYESALLRLSRRGYRRPTGATPREHAAALVADGAPGAAAFAKLVELFYDAEYGGRDGPRARSRAAELEAELWRALREYRGTARARGR